jgi:DivIVA domain-containing protein
MTWFFAVLIVALMGVTAVVATGRGGAMAEVYDDRPDARVPADGPLSAGDLEQVRFTTALRGYRMSEVDALLDRLVAELGEREAGGAVGSAQPPLSRTEDGRPDPTADPTPGRG